MISVFDPRAVRLHRARAAQSPDAADFLAREAAERLAERLEEVSRTFPLALDLGCRSGLLAKALQGRGGIKTLISTDPAQAFAAQSPRPAVTLEPEALPFAPASFDLVMSAISLHWVNDLPGALLQMRQALKPDGLLLVSLLGGETLQDLRAALMEAEIEEEGGASPRVSPFADGRDLGGLLQRAGFALPVVDSDTVTATYKNALALMRDLRAMGETNAVNERRKTFTRRSTLLRAAAIYQERHGTSDGRVPASFQIITLTGWAPHESQPQPLRRGSATTRLADALGSVEKKAGEKAP